MWKHVAVLLATSIAFGFSLVMMQRAIGLDSPWMVLLLFLCFLGLAGIAQPVYILKVPAGLRTLRPWEREGAIYRKFGVPAFGALLRNTPLRFLNSSVYVSTARRDLGRVVRQLESAEAIHFWGAVLLVPYLVFSVWHGKWAVLAAFGLVQVIGNAYPIMHLRMVRGRLERMLR
ncbi:MAG TPA: hypothetical protein VGI57_08865 [Usitatibacter sp.]|jgi:hypothetical protein